MPKPKLSPITTIVKRNGAVVPFKIEKITSAITKAMRASGEYRDGAPEAVARAVVQALEMEKSINKKFKPSVEGVQDIVEQQLIFKKFPATAKGYILYREKHAALRAFATHSSLGLAENYLGEIDWQGKEKRKQGYSGAGGEET